MRCARSLELTHVVAGNNKGTLSAKHHRKPSTTTREQARRINKLDLMVVTTGWRFESSPVHQFFGFPPNAILSNPLGVRRARACRLVVPKARDAAAFHLSHATPRHERNVCFLQKSATNRETLW
jgi:hypothetical protein